MRAVLGNMPTQAWAWRPQWHTAKGLKAGYLVPFAAALALLKTMKPCFRKTFAAAGESK